MSEDFQRRIGYVFANKELLKLAFTHSSYANENSLGTLCNNQRLEFLGDAVLELTISKRLYEGFPEMSEGALTKFRASLVCEGRLAKIARKIKLGDYLLFGKGEESFGGREKDSILADALEALFGAVYLDGGFQSASSFILSLFNDEINTADSHSNSFVTNDYKSYLQEIFQKKAKETVVYKIISENGPSHNKLYRASAVYHGTTLGVGEGKSKKEAEQAAAYDALVRQNYTFT